MYVYLCIKIKVSQRKHDIGISTNLKVFICMCTSFLLTSKGCDFCSLLFEQYQRFLSPYHSRAKSIFTYSFYFVKYILHRFCSCSYSTIWRNCLRETMPHSETNFSNLSFYGWVGFLQWFSLLYKVCMRVLHCDGYTQISTNECITSLSLFVFRNNIEKHLTK